MPSGKCLMAWDLSLYSPEDVELLIEERTCLHHYCGGVPWAVARQRAYNDVYKHTEVRRTPGGGVETRHTLVAPTPPKAKPAPAAEPEQQELFSQDEFRQAMRQIWKDY